MSSDIDYLKLRKVVEERGLTPCHAFFASFIASLSEAGILNQAIVNFMARRATNILHGYLKAMGFLKVEGASYFERFRGLVRSLNEALGIGERVEFRQANNDLIEVGIGGTKCRYCPRSVGRAEIPDTACPFPRLIEALAKIEGIPVSYEPGQAGGHIQALHREGGLCWIRYRIG